jgi:hypothetical protein
MNSVAALMASHADAGNWPKMTVYSMEKDVPDDARCAFFDRNPYAGWY